MPSRQWGDRLLHQKFCSQHPANMRLCEEVGLNQIPTLFLSLLDSTINMAGAAVTINTLTLAAANTLRIQVDFGTRLSQCCGSHVSACRASELQEDLPTSHPTASLASPMI